ncbi:MAG TPA: hypothetical protein VML50_14700 [Anaeromyxobacter sp.]|nr:hypothetical protein [Anaeromyxobacter sp.]
MVGVAVFGVLAASSALAQNADLSVTFTGPADISLGDTKAFTAKITNAGPNAATGVVITVTIPADTQLAGVSGCTLGTPSGQSTPCTVDDGIDVPGGLTSNVKTVTFQIAYPVPLDAQQNPIVPATCPSGTLGDVTVVVSSTTTSTPTNPTATVTGIALDPVTDLGIVVSGAPATANVGDALAYTVTVTNNGPCQATNVVVTDTDGVTNLSLGFVKSTGDCVVDPLGGCTTAAAPPAPSSGNSAKFAALDVGASLSFQSTYVIGAQPADLTQTRIDFNMDVSADQSDPDPSNNASLASTMVKQSTSGCSSAGLGTPLALLGLIALFARRRRTT